MDIRLTSLSDPALAGFDTIIDGRSPSEYAEDHLPGAINLPYNRLLNDDGTMKRGAVLARAFADAGVDVDRPVTTTCGSGVTAAILTLGLAELGKPSRLYDGSWSDWGARDDTPGATG